MKEKRRYLLYEVESEKRFSGEELKHCVYEGIVQFRGELGLSEANIKIIAFDENKQLSLIKCSLESVEQVIASLALKTEFRQAKIALRLKKIFGTLRKAKEIFPELRENHAKNP